MFSRDNYYNTMIFSVGIYLRLSKEDEYSKQSESITNQRDFVTSYVLEQGWNIYDVYIDDGFSGLNFDRPNFKRMIRDIEDKKINLVITKDLSRLGRDYIDTGYYLERYFPQKNIRYIALTDGIDTFSKNSNNDMSPFKSVINDMYAKDISNKIRAVMDTKRKNGQFIGSFAPYGYIKDPNNKNHFLIDNEASQVVKRIFDLYIKGNSIYSIVNLLNNENIDCPSKYKTKHSTYKNAIVKNYLWTHETIKRILTNPTYKGDMAQGRQYKINYKVKKFKKIPRENWIIANNTHEPIIDKKNFDYVQELLSKRTTSYTMPEKATHLLNGLLFCKDCGAKMTYRRNCTGKMVMMCMNYSRYGKSKCSSHRLNEKLVEDYVIGELKKIADNVINDEFCKDIKIIVPDNKDIIEKDLKQAEKKLEEIKNIIKALYVDKLKGILDEEMFLSISKEYNDEKEKLSNKIIQLIKKMEELENSQKEIDYISILKNTLKFDNLNKQVIGELINKIEISDKKEIFIYYNFKNPYK